MLGGSVHAATHHDDSDIVLTAPFEAEGHEEIAGVWIGLRRLVRESPSDTCVVSPSLQITKTSPSRRAPISISSPGSSETPIARVITLR